MPSRTTQTIVHFNSAFLLPGFDVEQPAGDYRVDHDEECVGGNHWLAWQRVGSFIHLPGIGRPGVAHQMVPIDPAAFDAAVEKDQTPS